MKQVNIIGLSLNQDFGFLKATKLTFNKDNRLTMIKGEVGAGKTTLNKAMRVTTQGSKTFEDSALYGDINLEAQLLDGEHKIFIGCKTDANGKLKHTLYELDDNGKKVNNPVIDGKKATPAEYMNLLQTSLTWRMNELTSENPTTQRNLLLELYSSELEAKGVVFDKKSPFYVGGIIDQIEKAKANRDLLDSKRKEVGGIQSDLVAKGIDVEADYVIKDTNTIIEKIASLKAEIKLKKENPETEKQNKLRDLKEEGSSVANKLRDINTSIVKANSGIQTELNKWKMECKNINDKLDTVKSYLDQIHFSDLQEVNKYWEGITTCTVYPNKPSLEPKQEILFNENGSVASKPSEWEENEEVRALLEDYFRIGKEYVILNKTEVTEVDTTELNNELIHQEKILQVTIDNNKVANSVIAFKNWRDSDQKVRDLNKDYFLKLTEISTGVEGLSIAPEYTVNDKGERVAKGNDIFLMYDGSYDPKYFSNPNKELRKLSSYSDTQKPMICLLIQNYLLSKKAKALRYLWIDQVPIDKKTKALLEKMSEELELNLFVNWTGDFERENLLEGEILVENGELFFNSSDAGGDE